MQCSLCSKAQTYNYNANTMPNFSSKPRDLRSTWTQYEATIGIQKPHAKPLKKRFHNERNQTSIWCAGRNACASATFLFCSFDSFSLMLSPVLLPLIMP